MAQDQSMVAIEDPDEDTIDGIALGDPADLVEEMGCDEDDEPFEAIEDADEPGEKHPEQHPLTPFHLRMRRTYHAIERIQSDNDKVPQAIREVRDAIDKQQPSSDAALLARLDAISKQLGEVTKALHDSRSGISLRGALLLARGFDGAVFPSSQTSEGKWFAQAGVTSIRKLPKGSNERKYVETMQEKQRQLVKDGLVEIDSYTDADIYQFLALVRELLAAGNRP